MGAKSRSTIKERYMPVILAFQEVEVGESWSKASSAKAQDLI
jgi:hypothetical protein